MKENIATIPLIDAFKADDECPFCNLERAAEQHAVSFILGSAYMEDDIRMQTDELGFCNPLASRSAAAGQSAFPCTCCKRHR